MLNATSSNTPSRLAAKKSKPNKISAIHHNSDKETTKELSQKNQNTKQRPSNPRSLLRPSSAATPQHKTVRLFHVADNISQTYLSHPCLLALSVAGRDLPRIDDTNSDTPIHPDVSRPRLPQSGIPLKDSARGRHDQGHHGLRLP